jgi:hypothetical protein
MRLPPKDPAEAKLVRFEFSTEIEAGSTIQSLTRTITTLAGTDASPSSVLDGSPTIDNANLYALQRVKDGLADCDYEIRMLATDNAGLKHLIVATLPVRTER